MSEEDESPRIDRLVVDVLSVSVVEPELVLRFDAGAESLDESERAQVEAWLSAPHQRDALVAMRRLRRTSAISRSRLGQGASGPPRRFPRTLRWSSACAAALAAGVLVAVCPEPSDRRATRGEAPPGPRIAQTSPAPVDGARANDAGFESANPRLAATAQGAPERSNGIGRVGEGLSPADAGATLLSVFSPESGSRTCRAPVLARGLDTMPEPLPAPRTSPKTVRRLADRTRQPEPVLPDDGEPAEPRRFALVVPQYRAPASRRLVPLESSARRSGTARAPGRFASISPADHFGYAADARAELFWFVSERPDPGSRVYLTVVDEARSLDLIDLELPVPRRSGLQRVELPRPLEADTAYRWSISISADPDHPALDQITSGGILYVPPGDSLRSRIAAAAPGAVPALWAEAGYFYDAFETLRALGGEEHGASAQPIETAEVLLMCAAGRAPEDLGLRTACPAPGSRTDLPPE